MDMDKLKSTPLGREEEEEEEEARQFSCSMSLSKRQLRAVEGEEQVERMWAAFDALRERERHFATFHQAVAEYERRRKEHERLNKQLQWVFGQVAQVEFEKDQACSATRSSPTTSDSSAERNSRHGIDSAGSTVRPRPLGAKKPRLQPRESYMQSEVQPSDVESRGRASTVETLAPNNQESFRASSASAGSKTDDYQHLPNMLALRLQAVGGTAK
ncbi:hypothetical protein PG988_004649 [Apiospora saccharicola]